MILNKKITIRLDEIEDKFLRNKSKEMDCSITDIVKQSLNEYYSTKTFKTCKDRKKEKWRLC